MKIRSFKPLSLVFASLLLAACSGNHPPEADFTVTEGSDEIRLTATAADEDGDLLTYHWYSDSPKVLFANTTQPETWFRIPSLDAPLDITVELTVSDGKDETVVTRNITLPELSQVRSWGLGSVLTKEVSNNVKREWYLDQQNSGRHSAVNCGPTSVTMAIRWADSLFTGTPADARNMYRPGGGWWYTDDIINYLNHYSVNNYTVRLSDMNVLTRELDKGNIAILCLDMYFIRDEENARWRVDKFYPTANPEWGHFIVAKGYKIVDDQLFLEIYDPYGFGKTYSDGSPKGKNRYYRGSDIDRSTGIWWDYAIIVSRSQLKSSNAVDPALVPRQHGG